MLGFVRPVAQCSMLVALFAGLGTATAVAEQTVLPPLTDPATHERHIGKPIFAELVTPDLPAAEKFYGSLLGWTFQEVPLSGIHYAEARLNGQPVAGLVERPIPAGVHRQSAWIVFISVSDVDSAQATATARGAKVLFAPHDVPGLGREAVFADPQGAVFAVLASASGDPPDVLAATGAWMWASLRTTDPDTDAAFYQALFNYDVFEIPGKSDAQRFILADDAYARASANPLPGDHPNAHPHWLDFVRVTDAQQAATQVTALGGRVLVPPRIDRQGGRVAVVTDPLGAPFGLMEWRDDADRAAGQ